MTCQCNAPSFDHDAGSCANAATYSAKRDGEWLLLCGDCLLSDDKPRQLIHSHNQEEKRIWTA